MVQGLIIAFCIFEALEDSSINRLYPVWAQNYKKKPQHKLSPELRLIDQPSHSNADDIEFPKVLDVP